MTIDQAYSELRIICAPFEPIPIIGQIVVSIPAGDIEATYHLTTRATADPRIQRSKPLFTRLQSWQDAVTGRKVAA